MQPVASADIIKLASRLSAAARAPIPITVTGVRLIGGTEFPERILNKAWEVFRASPIVLSGADAG